MSGFNLFLILNFYFLYIFFINAAKNKTTKPPKIFNLTQTLYEEFVYPDYIPYVPLQLCHLHYKIDEPVGNGSKIPFELIKLSPPKVTWPFRRGAKYTMIMSDLDNHDFDVYDMKEIFIWMVIDIPRNDIDKGRVVYKYFGDDEEPKAGNHRVLILIFEQKQTPLISFLDPVLLQLRWLYRIHEFADKYNLTTPPVAGNFFKLIVKRPRGITKPHEQQYPDMMEKDDPYGEPITRTTIDLYLGIDPKIINDELKDVMEKIRAYLTKVDRYTRFPTRPQNIVDW